MVEIVPNVQVDARGLACPLPVVKSSKAMKGLNPGEVLELLSTDKGSANDVRAWAATAGHEVIYFAAENGVYRFLIKKG